MATKENPGKFDCYANAKEDEPMFVLLARDPLAPAIVRAWRYLRAGMLAEAMLILETGAAALKHAGKTPLPLLSDKLKEADACATSMEFWRAKQPRTI